MDGWQGGRLIKPLKIQPAESSVMWTDGPHLQYLLRTHLPRICAPNSPINSGSRMTPLLRGSRFGMSCVLCEGGSHGEFAGTIPQLLVNPRSLLTDCF
jgi:hypothetical protein